MSGLSTLLAIGRSALNASQVALSVTGTNIANVDTTGYSRQSVELATSAFTQGVDVEGVSRSYDALIESQYLTKISARDRWSALYTGLSGVESLFNESNTDGVNSALSTMFSDWSELTSSTASNASTTVMLEDTQTLLSLLRSTADSLSSLKSDTQSSIADSVETLNDLASQIADLNKQIGGATENTESYNSLLDSRDALIEQVASLVDVKVVDNGGGDLSVYLTSGQTVVDGTSNFTFTYEKGKTIRQLSSTSQAANSDAQCYYEGSDSYEYTIKVVSNGSVGGGAAFEVSLDGGKTWLTDDAGNVLTYAANASNAKVTVGDLEIWFGTTSDSGGTPSADLEVGDTFTLVPKKAVYWYTSAGTPEIVSPQQYADGTDNTRRLTGGSLCGELELADSYIGSYQDSLDATAETMVWELNRIYSQGAGESAYGACTGTYSVKDASVALGDSSSGLTFGSRLTSGASMLYVYNASTGALVSGAAINFSSLPSALANFDPTVNSLQDVADAINNTFTTSSGGTLLTASIVNNQLKLTATDGYNFRFGDDSSGLYAALGLNTLLTGSTATDVAINSVMTTDTGKVCVGHVGSDGLVASGDTTTASAIAALQNVAVDVVINGKTVATQTLSDYYDTLVGKVGADTASASYQYSYEGTLASTLEEQKLSVSAVSLDEELTNLIMYQHSYQAAAKLISTADSMFDTILAMKS
jgi:flagellar hook-associated protein 1